MGVTGGRQPAALARLQRRFSTWRASRSVGERIPAALWRSAAEIATEHGLNRTADALKLDYYSLKKRVDDLGDETSSTAVATFIELSPTSLAATSECVIEIENGNGARMRVHLKGPSPDLLSLSRLLLDGE